MTVLVQGLVVAYLARDLSGHGLLQRRAVASAGRGHPWSYAVVMTVAGAAYRATGSTDTADRAATD